MDLGALLSGGGLPGAVGLGRRQLRERLDLGHECRLHAAHNVTESVKALAGTIQASRHCSR